jgi:hypothetical protein
MPYLDRSCRNFPKLHNASLPIRGMQPEQPELFAIIRDNPHRPAQLRILFAGRNHATSGPAYLLR